MIYDSDDHIFSVVSFCSMGVPGLARQVSQALHSTLASQRELLSRGITIRIAFELLALASQLCACPGR